MTRPGRGAYRYYSQVDFRGGINQEPENASPNQVLDAMNMWCPEGRLEQRPGYTGIISPVISYGNGTASTGEATRLEDVGGSTFTSTVGPIPVNYREVGDRLYLGTDQATTSFWRVDLNTQNTADTQLTWQYYNGTAWLACNVSYVDTQGYTPHYYGQNTTSGAVEVWLRFVPPQDWALTTVDSVSRYWLRATFRENAVAAGTDYQPTNAFYAAGTNSMRAVGVFTQEFPSIRRVLFSFAQQTNAGDKVIATWQGDSLRFISQSTGGLDITSPPTATFVPGFGATFLSFGDKVLEIPKANITHVEAVSTTAFNSYLALVETAPEWVGTYGGVKSPYHPDYIETLAAFPQAKFLSYFKGSIWAANTNESPYHVRWSVADPGGFRIWPTTNYEVIAEDDSSPITGMAPLHEHMVVFKQDSIWLMVDNGIDDLGQPSYIPRKIVSGIGCVAQTSIQEVNGRLFFLAEDGVYAFDGTPNVQKLSDSIDAKINSITKGVRAFCSSIHWRKKHCYLLSVATDGIGYNNQVLVYDYKHNAWWFWDIDEAAVFYKVEGQFDEEEIYFANDRGWVYQLDSGDTDHGGTISSQVTSHRFGETDQYTKSFRELRASADNNVLTLTPTLYVEDERDGVAGSLSLSDDAEVKLGSFTLGTSKLSNPKRRERTIAYRSNGQWAQWKIANTTKGVRPKINYVKLGYTTLGIR